MSRRNARKNVFYLLFQMDFCSIDEQERMKEIFFAEQEPPVEEADKIFILEEFDGTWDNLVKIDEYISKFAKGWGTDRISKVDLAILRLAIYEMKFSTDTPLSVAINEAVEISKKFSSDEAPAFINGILGKIASE